MIERESLKAVKYNENLGAHACVVVSAMPSPCKEVWDSKANRLVKFVNKIFCQKIA